MNAEGMLTVGIFIYDEVEVLDFCGPLEVFSSAVSMGDHRELFQTAKYMEYDWSTRGKDWQLQKVGV